MPFEATRSYEGSSTHTTYHSSSNYWYTRGLIFFTVVIFLSPAGMSAISPLLLNYLTHLLHCIAPACSLTGFALSTLYLCRIIPVFPPLKLLPHSKHNTCLSSLCTTPVNAHMYTYTCSYTCLHTHADINTHHNLLIIFMYVYYSDVKQVGLTNYNYTTNTLTRTFY